MRMCQRHRPRTCRNCKKPVQRYVGHSLDAWLHDPISPGAKNSEGQPSRFCYAELLRYNADPS